MEKLVKTLKINKLLNLNFDLSFDEKRKNNFFVFIRKIFIRMYIQSYCFNSCNAKSSKFTFSSSSCFRGFLGAFHFFFFMGGLLKEKENVIHLLTYFFYLFFKNVLCDIFDNFLITRFSIYFIGIR